MPCRYIASKRTIDIVRVINRFYAFTHERVRERESDSEFVSVSEGALDERTS